MEERIEMNRPTWVEIDLNKIENNFNEIKKITSNRKVICVVKADAYGLGAHEIANKLSESSAYAFAVASMEEALDLRSSGITKPILVLGYVDTRNLTLASSNGIRITLFDKDFIKRLKEYKDEHVLSIHVKVDTGMHRLGISPEEVEEVFNELLSLKNVIIEGIYTHFSSADVDREYTEHQIRKFDDVLLKLKAKNIHVPVVHAANSATILNFRNAYYDAVRPGILLYGFSPNASIKLDSIYQPAVSLKTRIIKVTNLKKGERISYGGTYETDSDKTIATLPIGYADGVPRLLSNVGYVLVKGRKARIVGTITMDMMMIDVTNFPYIHPGNEVVIFGSQNGENISLEEFSSMAKTIPYEILTRLNKRIRRVYLKNSV